MATANRAIVVGVSLLSLVVSCAVLIHVQLDMESGVGRVGEFARWLDTRDDRGLRLATTAASAAIALAAALILLLEWRLRPRTDGIRVPSATGDLTFVPLPAIARRLVEEVEATPHVQRADASAVAHGFELELVLAVDLEPKAMISEVTKTVSAQIRETVVRQMGIPLHGKPRISIRYSELDLRRADATPQSAPAGEPGRQANGAVALEEAPGAAAHEGTS